MQPRLLLTAALLLRRSGPTLSLPDAAALLTLLYLLGGFAVVLFATQIATALDDQRQNADQTRELLTARLQEQAAQLQELMEQVVLLHDEELKPARMLVRLVRHVGHVLLEVDRFPGVRIKEHREGVSVQHIFLERLV